MNEFDAIIHFAALIEAGESMKEMAAVYASKENPLVEEDPTDPAIVYGQSKRMVEEALTWYHKLFGLRSCSLLQCQWRFEMKRLTGLCIMM